VSDALQIGVALLIVGLGAFAVLSRRTFASIVGYIAYGLLLTLAWMQLRAPDVALTEAAIGGGLTGAMLIGAARRLRGSEAATVAQRPRLAMRSAIAVLCALVTAALAWSLVTLPEPAPSLASETFAAMPALGVGNPVTAVLLGFRALDTLLESIVLVLALIGVWSLAPDEAWGGRLGRPQHANPDGMLAYAARVLPPIGIVIGIYIFWIGADLPGGKFQGATLLAAMWLLVWMAGLADAPAVDRRALRWLLVGGPLAFVAIGMAGAFAEGAFLAYPDDIAKPLIIVIEIALMPTLTLMLALVLIGPPLRRVLES
jgi:multisubunit Na+/H+ antiporter MnhB subunit